MQVADLPIVLREMVGLSPGLEENDVGFGRLGDSVVTPAPMISDRNPRNRFKPRLQAKGISSLSNIPEINRRIMRPLDANKRVSDLKTEPGTGPSLTLLGGIELTSINPRSQFPPSTTINPTANAVRRDSISSNASSFYYSMKSADISRRNSQGKNTFLEIF